MKRAYYNDIYKKSLALAAALNAPRERELFNSVGCKVTNSQLQAWRVGRDHRHFRPIEEDYVLAYLDALGKWIDSNTE